MTIYRARIIVGIGIALFCGAIGVVVTLILAPLAVYP